MRRAVLATILLGFGCVHVSPAGRLLERFPLAEHGRGTYERTTDAGAAPEQGMVSVMRRMYTGPGGVRMVEVRSEERPAGAEAWHSGVLQRIDDGGIWNVAIPRADPPGSAVSFTVLDPIEPPQLVMPADAAPGKSWASEHLLAGARSIRKCSVRAFDACEGGLTVTCRTAWPEKGNAVTLANHYCPGLGEVGYDAHSKLSSGSELTMKARLEHAPAAR